MKDCSPRGEMLPGLSNQYHRFRSLRPRLFLGAVSLLLSVGVCMAPRLAVAQSLPTASRLGDLQIGGGFVFAKSNYNSNPINLIGGAAYTTFAIRPHWGGEFDFRHVRSTSDSTVYERTYEIGPRIFLTRGRLIPYAKVMYGRGVYNFSNNIANIAYNIYTFGGGADYSITRSINLRADYEYQNWMSFPLGTLRPSVVTIGAAYHFHE